MAISGGKLYATGAIGEGQLGLGGNLDIWDDLHDRTSFEKVSLSYTIKFDANGGTRQMKDQILTYGAYPEELRANIFYRDGYKFVGWSTTENGAKEYDDMEVYTLNN